MNSTKQVSRRSKTKRVLCITVIIASDLETTVFVLDLVILGQLLMPDLVILGQLLVRPGDCRPITSQTW